MKYLSLLLLLHACGKRSELTFSPTNDTQAETSRGVFSEEVKKKVLVPKCLSCHAAGEHAGHIPLATREDLLNMYVVPGMPEDSLFYTITAPGAFNMMPPVGTEPLTISERKIIREWILEGAPE